VIYTPDGCSVFSGSKVADVILLPNGTVWIEDLPRPEPTDAPATPVITDAFIWPYMSGTRCQRRESATPATAPHIPTAAEKRLRDRILAG